MSIEVLPEAVDTADTTLVCGDLLEQCICVEAPAHDGAHICKCTGSWSVDADGKFHVHAWPQPMSGNPGDIGNVAALMSALGFFGGDDE